MCAVAMREPCPHVVWPRRYLSRFSLRDGRFTCCHLAAAPSASRFTGPALRLYLLVMNSYVTAGCATRAIGASPSVTAALVSNTLSAALFPRLYCVQQMRLRPYRIPCILDRRSLKLLNIVLGSSRSTSCRLAVVTVVVPIGAAAALIFETVASRRTAGCS